MMGVDQTNQTDQIRQYVTNNLPALAAEVIDWKLTGLLFNYKDKKIRELVAMIDGNLPGMDGLKLAETMICRAALEYVVRHSEGVK